MKPKTDSVISDVDMKRLLEAARDVRLRAYTPYSNYKVGAAVLTADGQVCGGCNVENASYPLCMCAERVAIGSAVATGAGKPLAIAVVTENAGSPCGGCRQVLAEMNPNMVVIIATAAAPSNGQESCRITTAAELLPDQFQLG